MKIKSTFLFFVILCLQISTANAARTQVNSYSDGNTNDGTCTLREAILAFNDGSDANYSDCQFDGTFGSDDKIYLENGSTYTLSEVGDDDSGVQGDLDILTGLTILTNDENGDPAYIQSTLTQDRIFDIHTNDDLSLNNLYVMNPKLETTVNTDQQMGAFLRSYHATNPYTGNITLNNITIDGGEITFNDTNNTSNRNMFGGFIYILGEASQLRDLNITNLVFRNNSALTTDFTSPDSLLGGLMFTNYVNVSISGAEITNTTLEPVKDIYGGFRINNADSLTIENMSFSNSGSDINSCSSNSRTNGAAGFCALFTQNVDHVEISNSTFSDIQTLSFASGNGPIAIVSSNNTVFNNTTISNNSINAQGDAVAALFIAATNAAINFSTISDNQVTSNSSAYGGGLTSFGGTVYLKSSILADNTVSGSTSAQGNNCYIYSSGQFISLNHNIIDDLSDCSITDWQSTDNANDLEDTDLDLELATDNGGDVFTVAIATTDSPKDNSDCLAFASDGATSSAVTTDARGESRGTSTCDSGAYEYTTSSGGSRGGSGSNSGSGSASGNGSEGNNTTNLPGNEATPETSSGGCQFNANSAYAFNLTWALFLILPLMALKKRFQ